MPLIDIGEGEPLVFLPILEHLEWVYARQVKAFSRSRRVTMYRRRENRARFVGLAERAAELLDVLDSLGLQQADLAGHGDAAMVLFEFAIQYPGRCCSLIIIAQAADYQIAPHPFIWLLQERENDRLRDPDAQKKVWFATTKSVMSLRTERSMKIGYFMHKR